MYGAGVIDTDYRGEVVVHMYNLGEHDYTIKAGQRFVQFVIQKYATPTVREVDTVEIDTVRGESGLGSSGEGVVLQSQSRRRSGPGSTLPGGGGGARPGDAHST